ncbi:MAG TPA: endo-1,4-beta-xylanase, partial [Gammaproteobacteria bacterium]
MNVNFLRVFLLSVALLALTGCKLFEYGNDDETDTDPPPEEPNDPVIGPLDKLFGTAPGDEGDYDDLLTYFNQLTPENAGKWGEVESTRDTMDWEDLDFAHDFAQNNGLSYKHHVLIWGQQEPAWIGALDATEQLAEIEEWMAAVAARYPNLEFVEVVNEPLHAPPSYKDALGGDGVTGYDWVITAFEMAREHFPNAQLLLNDYQILHLEANTAEYLALIQLLLDRDLIDAIGLEAHFLEQTAPAMVQINLDTLADTGLPIYITEFDLNLADDARHANVMSQLFPVFWEHPAVEGVTHWGHRQGSVWQANAYLINSDGTERPALEWLVCYLNGGTDCTVPELVFNGWQGTEAGLILEAELYDQGEGIVAVGEVVGYTNGGDWIAFKGVEFQGGWDTLEVRYSKGVDEAFPATITVHLGSLENPAQATVDLTYTGGWGTFNTVEVPWPARTDTQDVYISFNTDEAAEAVGNLDKVSFLKSMAPDDGDNLVTDGGFEGLAVDGGWSSWNGSTLSLSTAQAFAGSQSLLATNRPDTNQFAVYSLTGKVAANTTYSVSAQVYQAGAGVDTVRLAAKVDCTDATMPVGFNEFPWLDNNAGVNPAEWTELSADLVIPDCELVDVVIFIEGTTAGVDVYIDEVKVLPPAGGDDSLVTDGGFEGLAVDGGWSSWNGSTLSLSTAQKFAGSQSLLATGRPDTNQFAVYSLTGKVAANTTYSVSA